MEYEPLRWSVTKRKHTMSLKFHRGLCLSTSIKEAQISEKLTFGILPSLSVLLAQLMAFANISDFRHKKCLSVTFLEKLSQNVEIDSNSRDHNLPDHSDIESKLDEWNI